MKAQVLPGTRQSGSGPTIGVLALQGGVAEHAQMLSDLGATVRLVRKEADLESHLDGIVLPGGESSTIDRLLKIFNMKQLLADLLADGLPCLATCAGMILVSRKVLDAAPGQTSLGVLDTTVSRNVYGSQTASAEVTLDTTLGPVRGAFIRAPKIVRVGEDVQGLARRMPEQGGLEEDGDIVAVRGNNIVALSFHPELTGDATFHTDLLNRLA